MPKMPKRKPTSLIVQLQAAVRSSGMSLRAIASKTEIDVAVLSKFMNQKGGLSLNGIERLADVLGVEIVVRRVRDRKAK
jgi:hypothetical protein